MTDLRLVIVAALMLSACSASDYDRASAAQGATLAARVDDPLPPVPRNTRWYAPPEAAEVPESGFNGTLRLSAGWSEMEVLRDDFSIARDASLRVSELPQIVLQLAQHGARLLPLQGPVLETSHPLWNLIPEAGTVWRERDSDGWNRAVLPFSLQERLQNCVHNGLLTFRYHDDGRVDNASWQIGSETCLYFKFNAWGESAIDFDPGPVPEAAALIEAFDALEEVRLPVAPLDQLAELASATSLADLAPPNAEHATVYGLVVDEVHYRSECPTRFGAHPYCDQVALPSYSTAKGLFAGLVFLALRRMQPALGEESVLRWIPECANSDDRWRDVRLKHLAHMTTGLYQDPIYQEDETSEAMGTFFLATNNADRIRFSCDAWPRRAAPGTRPVYHSTDHFLLGVALTRYLRQQGGGQPDLFEDYFYPGVLAPAHPGPLLRHTLRTLDADRQPFLAYGLFYHPDDVARLGQYLMDKSALKALLGPVDHERILFEQRDRMQRWQLARGEGYFAGFWGFDAAAELGCETPAWIPFLSGYGGIRWALLPNGMVYYFFSDGGHGPWSDALAVAHQMKPLCQ